ncbi:flagellar hook assembly protein FlgD [Bacillus mesophilum]|uniref:Basal-body rod modification protein FlgD n=1 Tax=Bacillus mesophilum TaxID=1071718 RepID=A0A7V7UXB7_9BACI|nr:flagellar hook assembly protein FlgD [Bacillus mesophilum]KAB2335424.1 flagellar hook assembly protein FlgD [Bacillus mesophilum]
MTNSIDSALLLSNYQNQTKKTGSDVLGKDDFLKILMAQLQNQDPSSPMEDKDFIAQMATFSSLEQMTNMNTTLESFLKMQEQSQMISYNAFIGKEVNWHKVSAAESENNAPVIEEGTGRVASIQFKDNSVTFILEDGTKLTPGNISQVNETSKENAMLQASMMIGKTVTYLDADKKEHIASIQSVSFKNGKTLFQLNDEAKTAISSSQIVKIES